MSANPLDSTSFLLPFLASGAAGRDGAAQVQGADGRGAVAVEGGRHQERLQGERRHAAQR